MGLGDSQPQVISRLRLGDLTAEAQGAQVPIPDATLEVGTLVPDEKRFDLSAGFESLMGYLGSDGILSLATTPREAGPPKPDGPCHFKTDDEDDVMRGDSDELISWIESPHRGPGRVPFFVRRNLIDTRNARSRSLRQIPKCGSGSCDYMGHLVDQSDHPPVAMNVGKGLLFGPKTSKHAPGQGRASCGSVRLTNLWRASGKRNGGSGSRPA